MKSGVRIAHIPTGIIVHIEDSEVISLARLYRKAKRILRTRLYALQHNLPGAEYIETKLNETKLKGGNNEN